MPFHQTRFFNYNMLESFSSRPAGFSSPAEERSMSKAIFRLILIAAAGVPFVDFFYPIDTNGAAPITLFILAAAAALAANALAGWFYSPGERSLRIIKILIPVLFAAVFFAAMAAGVTAGSFSVFSAFSEKLAIAAAGFLFEPWARLVMAAPAWAALIIIVIPFIVHFFRLRNNKSKHPVLDAGIIFLCVFHFAVWFAGPFHERAASSLGMNSAGSPLPIGLPSGAEKVFSAFSVFSEYAAARGVKPVVFRADCRHGAGVAVLGAPFGGRMAVARLNLCGGPPVEIIDAFPEQYRIKHPAYCERIVLDEERGRAIVTLRAKNHNAVVFYDYSGDDFRMSRMIHLDAPPVDLELDPKTRRLKIFYGPLSGGGADVFDLNDYRHVERLPRGAGKGWLESLLLTSCAAREDIIQTEIDIRKCCGK